VLEGRVGTSAALTAELAGQWQMWTGVHLRRGGREQGPRCWDALGCGAEPGCFLLCLPDPTSPKV